MKMNLNDDYNARIDRELNPRSFRLQANVLTTRLIGWPFILELSISLKINAFVKKERKNLISAWNALVSAKTPMQV